jgi:hypothetical protein
MRTLTAAVLCGLAIAAAGCGDDDDDGGSGSIAEAKQALIDDCHEGHEGDDKDLKLCECIADQLQAKHGYDTAKEFDAARKSVADDEKVPTQVMEAASSPECQQAQQ